MKMKEQPSYPKTDAKLKPSGSAKDASAYSGKADKGGAARKGASLDAKASMKKGEPNYKEHCKDE